jgi:CRISPR-associated protein Cas2
MLINEYRVMWMYLFFDLPTETKKNRKDYTVFRKYLLSEGFSMHQYSVYYRCCPSMEFTAAMAKRLEKRLPPKGSISIMEVTDKQFGRIKHFENRTPREAPSNPGQIAMF